MTFNFWTLLTPQAWFTLLFTFILGVFGLGCSEESAKYWTETVGATASSLEDSGADWRMDAYLPSQFETSWNPFGFRTGFPGGYARFYAGTGRPRGLRQSDVDQRLETDPIGEMVEVTPKVDTTEAE